MRAFKPLRGSDLICSILPNQFCLKPIKSFTWKNSYNRTKYRDKRETEELMYGEMEQINSTSFTYNTISNI